MKLKEMKQWKGYVFNTNTNNIKLELEKVYKEYCLKDIECIKEEDKKNYKMFKSFIDFRLDVSGGNKSTMGSVGCGSVSGFLNEIILFNDLMDDFGGAYRGDFASECGEDLEGLLENCDFKQEVVEGLDIKKLIMDLYDEYHGLNKYEE
jgi:hypothetical protein